jgi:hypothetical protein
MKIKGESNEEYLDKVQIIQFYIQRGNSVYQ